MCPCVVARLLGVRLQLSSSAAVDNGKRLDGMRRQRPERIYSRLAFACTPQRESACHVGVVENQTSRTTPRGILGAREKEHRAITKASLLVAPRCGTVVAIVPAQVDSGGSPQRTAFPTGSSRK